MAQGATILVKKSDGTQVRVSFDEFKKMKQNAQADTLPVMDKPQSSPSADMLSMDEPETSVSTTVDSGSILPQENIGTDNTKESVEEKEPVVLSPSEVSDGLLDIASIPHELSTTTPVTDIFVDEARARSAWSDQDHKSLLEEDEDEIEELKKKGAVHVDNQVAQKRVSAPPIAQKKEDSLQQRITSLIVSWQKGIRDDRQFLAYAERPVMAGGLGFSSAEAQQLLQQTKMKNIKDTTRVPKMSNVDRPLQAPLGDTEKQETQDMSVVDDHIISVKQDTRRSTNYAQPRSTFHDVEDTTREQKTTGPTDEMRVFSLIDFRRLSNDPKVACEMVVSKFEGWKEESFILYIDTIAQWKQSPLYKRYIEITVDALRQQKSVEDILRQSTGTDDMHFHEYTSIASINQKLMV